MPRDYKNSVAKNSPPVGAGFSWLSFGSGLTAGLFVAFLVYLELLPLPANSAMRSTEDTQPQQDTEQPVADTPAPIPAPKRKFDFYTILPQFEIKVPEWSVSSDNPAQTQIEAGSYVLQVGSFQRYAEADRVKARLALQGIAANIHRVVIDGQDVWYRVLVGPFTEPQELQAMRQRLSEHGMKYMMAKVKAQEPT